MKPTKEQIKQYASQALERALATFGKLDDKEWGKKANDGWTATEVLGHLTATQETEGNHLIQQALSGQQGAIDGLASRADTNSYNEKTLATVRDLSVPELFARYRSAFEEMLRMLEGVSEGDLDKPATSPGWDKPGTVRDLFFGNYLHLPGHYQDIRRVNKKKLPHWVEASAPEEVHFQMDRTFHYMPLIFQSAANADMKATYLFTLEGAGGGQWALQIADGNADAQAGPPESFDAEVKTKPELWIDLTNNDLNPMWAITTRKVQLGGNPALAMKLGQLFRVAD